MAEVTFVIPCYQCRSTIGETLEAVFGQRGGFDLEVVVVDSGSDGAGEWVASCRPRCRVLASSQRLTPGQARNRELKGSVPATWPLSMPMRFRRRIGCCDYGNGSSNSPSWS